MSHSWSIFSDHGIFAVEQGRGIRRGMNKLRKFDRRQPNTYFIIIWKED